MTRGEGSVDAATRRSIELRVVGSGRWPNGQRRSALTRRVVWMKSHSCPDEFCAALAHLEEPVGTPEDP